MDSVHQLQFKFHTHTIILKTNQFNYLIIINMSTSSFNSSPLVQHIYASVNWVNIGSDNGLSSIQRQTIIWTNAGILLIKALQTSVKF